MNESTWIPEDVDPDPFQVDAVEHLDLGRSVVVCAPTGSGKTLIAEAAARMALVRGGRLFYTTPLKALSNQKFRDLGELFASDRCGLLTGDISIRPEAPLVVMTTEVFRNMLLRPDAAGRTVNLQFVVLDECHYLGRFGRGTVWEEAILACPPGIQILALSATIANAEQVVGWMDSVHPTTVLVEANDRPVPLRTYFFRADSLRKIDPAGPPHRGAPASRPAPLHRQPIDPENPENVLAALAEQEMLPAIFFVFSRRGCENAAEACAHLDLLSAAEAGGVERAVNEFQVSYPSVGSYPFLPLLFRGLAIHHAGMLPGWRVVVERLFQRRLIKAVFATETLAAGMNMPARTTVISALRRPGEKGYRPLTATEFHQMAGRAGRRGMDAYGNVVIPAGPDSDAARAAAYAQSRPEPLGSCLYPGYSLVLNWLPEYGEERCRRLISQGLAAYLAVPHPGNCGGTELPAWRRFQAARAILEHLGLLENGVPVGAGRLAASLQTENELLAALVLDSALPDNPPPALVAAVAGGLSGVPGRTSGTSYAGRGGTSRPSREFRTAMGRAAAVVASVEGVQREFRLSYPTVFSTSFARLAAAWASGAGWGEVLDLTELDEGDVAYGLRSTLDLLHQLAEAPASPALQQAAVEASARIDRSPVSEVL